MTNPLKEFVKQKFRSIGIDVQLLKNRDALSIQRSLLRSIDVETIVDAGAYHGEWTQNYRASFANANIFALEPTSETRKLLVNRFGSDPKIKILPNALGEYESQGSLFINEHLATNSVLKMDERARTLVSDDVSLESFSTEPVHVTTLDKLSDAQGMTKINLLKMDIQGSELSALRGAANLLSRRAIDLIYTELIVGPHYVGQGNYFDICKFLSDYGYPLFNFYNLALNQNGRLCWMDAIFARSELVECVH